MRNVKGFTLVELIVTVAIVALLSAVAIPSYLNYVVKSNRAAAQAFMVNVENRQKQYMLDARSYATSVTALSMTPPDNVAKFYNVTICIDQAGLNCSSASTPPYFQITATPVAGTKQVSDGNLTLDSTGAKTPQGKW